METRPLTPDDLPALMELLERAPTHNVFHLSGLREHGLARSVTAPEGKTWAIGVFENERLVGAVVALRGTGGVYDAGDDQTTLSALASIVIDRASTGSLSLLSGHASQIGPLLPMAGVIGGMVDYCRFRTLSPYGFLMPAQIAGFGRPRQAHDDDLERLIDFYEIGFYSLAHLPTRAAWRNRLAEQLAFRTLYIIEDSQGNVASAAMSSAETEQVAMLGGVATREKYRGRGLSTLCVGALCGHLFNRGITNIALFYLRDNAPAASVYDKLGFDEAGEWLLAPVGMGASFAPLLGTRPR